MIIAASPLLRRPDPAPECLLKPVELKPTFANSIAGETDTQEPPERRSRPQYAAASC